MKSTGLAFLFCVLAILSLNAQDFGGFPPSTRWKQINSDTARIIYSRGAEDQAARIAALIQRAAADTPFSLGNRMRKINVVLQSRTTLANGYVALGPFRSEFYLIPGANIYEFGTLPWHENLALHEYRHVQQYANFRNGLSKFFFYLFGENGQAFGNAMSIPDWFFEGDAVHTETALTHQGRGRLPYFLSGYNSLWLAQKNYSWMKLRNGSLKDYVPNHYQLGYLLANYGYLKYGDDFWRKVTRDASAFEGLVYPFQQAVKRHSGVDYKTFRTNALDYYKQQLDTAGRGPAARQQTVTNYYYPQYIGADSLLYLKTAYNKLPAFYIRHKGREKKIALKQIGSEEWFSFRRGKVAYTAYATNSRWSLIDYNDIVVLDVKRGTSTRLTHKGKFFTPDFSPSGNRLVAVRVTDSLHTDLQVLNAGSGAVEKTVRAVNDWYYTNPRFVDENTIVVGRRSPDSRMSLQLYHLDTDRWEEVLPATYTTISLPFVQDRTIYFTANFTANDELYALQLADKKLYRLTAGVTGNYFPSAYKDAVVWSHFTADGLGLQQTASKDLLWAEVPVAKGGELASFYPVAGGNKPFSVPEEHFEEKRYSKAAGLLRFHSWMYDYTTPEFTFSLYSNNLLNTLSTELYYRYNQNETSSTLGVNLAYAGFYPVIRGGAEYTFNTVLNLRGKYETFEKEELSIGAYLPYTFTRGKTYKLLAFGTDYTFNRMMPVGVTRQRYREGDSRYLQHFLNWRHQLPKAVQHIYPKLGYAFSNRYANALNGEGYQFFNATELYLPSVGNHSLVLTGSIQDRDSNNYSLRFSNHFANTRGYPDVDSARMIKLSANYHFPIAYPDFGVGNIVFLQRLRGNVFYDHGQLYNDAKTASRTLRSTGAELIFDTKWWNQLPVSFGFRVSHLMDDLNPTYKKGKNYFEVIVPVNLIPNQ